MANLGVSPPDLSTNVGKFRLNTNDTVWTELDPPVIGMGDYTHSSDEEIEAYLAQGDDSLSRSLGYYFQYLAGQAALTATNIADHDLKVQTEKRAELLAKVADQWFNRADMEDDANGVNDLFDAFIFGSDRHVRVPEAAPIPVY